jgi:hypothetical protein
MKKYSVLLAIIALVLASLACQTIMGGGEDDFTPDVQEPTDLDTDAPEGSGDDTTNFNVGGDSEFAMPNDAFNVVTADDVLTFQTNLSAEETAGFYRDEFGKQGYSEDSSMSVTFGGNFTLVFTGHDSGKSIYVVGADAGDGSLYVTVTLQ